MHAERDLNFLALFGERAVLSRGGEFLYNSDGDARRLVFGCKRQIFVSLRVFGMESHYICPYRYRFVLFLKKFTEYTENAPTLTTQKSPLGVNLSFSHTHIGLLWEFNLNFWTRISVRPLYGSPPGCFVFTVTGPNCCVVPAISGEGYKCP